MKHLVLIGGGHAHAVVLAGLARRPLEALAITLVTPNAEEMYTGMLPGVLAGHYSAEEARMDLAGLAERAGAGLFRAAVATLDPVRRIVALADGREAAYDLVSLDVGAIASAPIPGAREHAIPVKPFGVFLDALGQRDAGHVAFIGGGAAGVELAMALRHRGLQATVYSGRSPFAPELEQRIGAALRARGVSRIGLGVDAIEGGGVVRAQGAVARYDAVVLATGASPWPWLRSTGLQLDDKGFVLVDPTLRSVSHPEVFAVGDCATLADAPHPKAGVYAVRHGHALLANLRRLAAGQPLRPFVPQRRALMLVSCGGKYAIGERGSLTFEGAWAWRWKSWIDRRWVRQMHRPR